jgi:hypothetical protein
MHRLDRREMAKKRWLHEYSLNEGPWFRANDLYDASRKLIRQGHAGATTAYAANGTPSFIGSLEHWAGLELVERDRGGLRVGKYVERGWNVQRTGN